MNCMKKLLCRFVVLTMPCCVIARAQSGRESLKSPQEFVQSFYNWYGPVALSGKNPPTWNSVLELKKQEFSPLLIRLLKEDAMAQSKCNELMSFDFDPFLNTQEPAERYEVVASSQQGRTLKAEVYAVRFGKRGEKPEVVVKLAQQDGNFQIVNFLYPSNGTNLVAILKSPRPRCTVPRAAPKSRSREWCSGENAPSREITVAIRGFHSTFLAGT